MTTLFISDLHLDQTRPDITSALLEFLDSRAKHAEALYILGDFFEVWLGDDHSSDFNEQITMALQELPVPLFLMHGNRDFLLGQRFCELTGATLLEDPSVIELNGEPVLLMHGDSLCTGDEQYMQVRKLLRDENFQRDFLTKSIPERQAFADSARSQSKEHTREAASDIMDVTASEVVLAMREHGVTTFIHGHTHRPQIHNLEIDGLPARRIVLGDWDRKGWFLESSQQQLRLHSFDITPT